MAPHTSRNILLSSLLILAPMFLLTACVASNGVNDDPQTPALDISADSTTTKTVYIDGSSTVFPITEAIAQAYKAEVDNSQVVVSFSGTGGGFDKFCAEETDINDASRPISVQEMEACDRAGIRYIEKQKKF
ncbi:MAG: substrate-binding domain-containing protein [Elainellaceae cyanobacterium]